MNTRLAAFAITMSVASILTAAENPFAQHVRPTDPLTAEEQLKTFHLPPGFKIQLVAAEPNLRKPMNMAFDSIGRLWVTESREYPIFAKPDEPKRDTVRIFSDFDENGRARNITTFATNLNIPIGIYPFRSVTAGKSTWSCIAWSIPNIWRFEDTDGDGKADKQEKLYGPFDYTRDTHGNQSSFRRGNDGWIYATHGFNNNSKVAGTDGHEITMQSGNTYRFRLDGSRIEHWTHGQVNPFGLAFDKWGNLFSADCHSSPIYQLLRGAYYPSFGKPHDGLGFAPVTIQHTHGSTAIAGIVVIEDAAWPAEFQGNILIGNVMTSRVNRDRVEWKGSSSIGHELNDFVKCDDPWFRPVALQLGPDGALYIGDFYNRIIGHYEVPLDHPGRDRERGRIWRIIPPGVAADVRRLTSDNPKPPPLALATSTDDLINELMSSNLARRSLAMNELTERLDPESIRNLNQAAEGLWHFRLQDDRTGLMTSALWLLHRAGQLDELILLKALEDRNETVRVQAARIACEIASWSDELAGAVEKQFADKSALVHRTAAEAFGLHPKNPVIKPLVELLDAVPTEDTHLRHAVRVALRNQLADADATTFKQTAAFNASQRETIADICLAIPSEPAAQFIFLHGMRKDTTEEIRREQFRHVTRYLGYEQLEEFARTMRKSKGESLEDQLNVFRYFIDGLTARTTPGNSFRGEIGKWGGELAAQLLTTKEISKPVWGNTPLPNRRRQDNPWTIQERGCADGQTAQLISSHPRGERLTGRLRSKSFRLPEKLSFYLCGHRGFPDKPAHDRNRIRLRDAASGNVLKDAFPPRHDTARLIEWDLKQFVGRRGYIEVIDGDSDAAYAWLAFGRFEPALPELALQDPQFLGQRMFTAASLVRRLDLKGLIDPIRELLIQAEGDADARAEAASAYASLSGGGIRWALASVIGNIKLPDQLRDNFAGALASDMKDYSRIFEMAMMSAGANQQMELATALAGIQPGAELLLQLVERGKTSPRVLLDTAIAAKLKAANPTKGEQRLASLTRNLPPQEENRDQLIRTRIAGYRGAKPDLANGMMLFETACAACHQLGGKGNIVGPQLDGIGNRGVERLIEDIIDPNRNVDVAFRAESIVLKNGDLIAGLVRKDEGNTVLLANNAGQEVRLPKSDIQTRSPSIRSLMPDNFHEAMTSGQLNDLLRFLLSAKSADGH